MKISKRNKILKKILGYFSLSLISLLIIFFIWKREFRKDEMEQLVVNNSWDNESGKHVGPRHMLSHQDYTINNLQITFHTGETCTVLWAYGNTLIIRDTKKNFIFYERWRGSDRWHEIW